MTNNLTPTQPTPAPRRTPIPGWIAASGVTAVLLVIALGAWRFGPQGSQPVQDDFNLLNLDFLVAVALLLGVLWEVARRVIGFQRGGLPTPSTATRYAIYAVLLWVGACSGVISAVRG